MSSPNPQRIKVNRSYTVKELALLLGVDKKTILRWIKQGLQAVDARRPLLILGKAAKQFLQQKRNIHRQTCPVAHLFCVRCQAPKLPAGNMVDWLANKSGSGLLQGICPDCGGLIHRGVAAAKLEAVTKGLEVTLPRAQRSLSEASSPLRNVHLGAELHGKN
jgi:excisionase family DNA binding protein